MTIIRNRWRIKQGIEYTIACDSTKVNDALDFRILTY